MTGVIRVYCEGSPGSRRKPANRHKRRYLGDWKRLGDDKRNRGWWPHGEPADVSFDSQPPYRRHRSIEVQEIDRGPEFEEEHGYRWQHRIHIWCTKCAADYVGNAKGFNALMDYMAEKTIHREIPLRVLHHAVRSGTLESNL